MLVGRSTSPKSLSPGSKGPRRGAGENTGGGEWEGEGGTCGREALAQIDFGGLFCGEKEKRIDFGGLFWGAVRTNKKKLQKVRKSLKKLAKVSLHLAKRFKKFKKVNIHL